MSKRRKLRVSHLAVLILVPVLVVTAAAGGVLKLLSSENRDKSGESVSVHSSSAGSAALHKRETITTTKNETERKQQKTVETVKNTAAGSLVDVSSLDQSEISSLFYQEAIPDDVLASMEGVAYVSG